MFFVRLLVVIVQVIVKCIKIGVILDWEMQGVVQMMKYVIDSWVLGQVGGICLEMQFVGCFYDVCVLCWMEVVKVCFGGVFQEYFVYC